MKKYHTLYICIFALALFVSCRGEEMTSVTSSIDKDVDVSVCSSDADCPNSETQNEKMTSCDSFGKCVLPSEKKYGTEGISCATYDGAIAGTTYYRCSSGLLCAVSLDGATLEQRICKKTDEVGGLGQPCYSTLSGNFSCKSGLECNGKVILCEDKKCLDQSGVSKCADGQLCNDGVCVAIPNAGEKGGACLANSKCGDGLNCVGGICEEVEEQSGCIPACTAEQVCSNGACTDKKKCEADCSGHVCGDDGCGGSCGTCASDKFCENGKCRELDTPISIHFNAFSKHTFSRSEDLHRITRADLMSDLKNTAKSKTECKDADCPSGKACDVFGKCVDVQNKDFGRAGKECKVVGSQRLCESEYSCAVDGVKEDIPVYLCKKSSLIGGLGQWPDYMNECDKGFVKGENSWLCGEEGCGATCFVFEVCKDKVCVILQGGVGQVCKDDGSCDGKLKCSDNLLCE